MNKTNSSLFICALFVILQENLISDKSPVKNSALLKMLMLVILF